MDMETSYLLGAAQECGRAGRTREVRGTRRACVALQSNFRTYFPGLNRHNSDL